MKAKNRRVTDEQTSRPLTVVGVSGSPTRPSRTTALVQHVTDVFAGELEGEAVLIELAPLLGELGAGPYRTDLGADAVRALEAVERADVLVVGSPAYRATYTGLFKLFFDHVGQYALVDKPIVLTATGGSDRHALLVEHQMRPLFGFFQSLTLPLGIFANEGDFTDYRVDSPELEARIQQSLSRTMPLLSAHLRLDPRFAPAAAAPSSFARPDWA